MHIRQTIVVQGAVLAMVAVPAAAQTDYYDTDRNRPVRVEDARGLELGALKVRLAPVTLEWREGEIRRWELDPEIAWGVLPRTTVEIGLPIRVEDGDDDGRSVAVSGVALSVFHGLNVETRTLPALAVRGDLLFERNGTWGVRPAVTAIATRTFAGVRVHGNVLVAGGGGAPDGDRSADSLEAPARWLAGVAIDRAFPLDSFLLTASVHAEAPVGGGGAQWVAASGIRYQVSPNAGLDAGIGRRFGPASGWSVTIGTAIHFAIPAFLRGGGRRPAETQFTGGDR